MCSYSYLDTILLWKYSIFDANFTCSTVGSQLSALINVIFLLCYYFSWVVSNLPVKIYSIRIVYNIFYSLNLLWKSGYS